MKTVFLMKIAASSLVLGTMAGGYSGAGVASAPSAAAQTKIAVKAAAAASKHLAKRNFARAVESAEAAVSASPETIGYRILLGQAYLNAGRFTSAETAFGDVLSLDPDNAKAALNLALSQIANGHNDAAMRTLDTHRTALSAADYGLAVALAGDPPGGVAVLETASRDVNADMKIRQNLALAYALAGKWMNARVLAAQDLSPELLDERMTQWASFVQPRGASQQVAMLLGVTPVDDAGRPEALALRSAAPQTAAVAAPAPAERPVTPAAVSAVTPAHVAAVEPMVVPVDVTPTAVFEMQAEPPVPLFEAPLIRSEPAPVKQVVVAAAKPAPRSLVRKASKTPATTAATKSSSPRGIESGKFVVQLGAFGSASRAQTAWNGALRKTTTLANYAPATARVKVNAGSLYRMSVSGFTTRAAAGEVCARVKANGGTCFVRSLAGDAPTQWVQRGFTRVASR